MNTEAAKIDESQDGSMPEPQEEQIVEQPEVETPEVVEDEAQEDSNQEDAKRVESVPFKSYERDRHKWKRKVEAAADESEETKRQLEAIRQENALLKTAAGLSEEVKTGMPDRYDYDDDATYQGAVQEYIASEAEKQVDQKLTAYQEQQQQQYLQQQAEEAQEKAITTHYEKAADLGATDFLEAENQFKEIYGTEAALQLMQGFEGDSAKVFYHLGKNPDKATELLKNLEVNPVSGLIAITRYVDSVGNIQTNPTPDPDVPETNTGGGVSVDWNTRLERAGDQLDKGSISMQDYLNLRNQAREAGVNI